MFEVVPDGLLESGAVLESCGGSFQYVVVGPVCRLYDREELPWPSCSIGWRGKQPSWRRIGARFVADMATKRCPSYSVMLGGENLIISAYWMPLSPVVRRWWHMPLSAELSRFWSESVVHGKLVQTL